MQHDQPPAAEPSSAQLREFGHEIAADLPWEISTVITDYKPTLVWDCECRGTPEIRAIERQPNEFDVRIEYPGHRPDMAPDRIARGVSIFELQTTVRKTMVRWLDESIDNIALPKRSTPLRVKLLDGFKTILAIAAMIAITILSFVVFFSLPPQVHIVMILSGFVYLSWYG